MKPRFIPYNPALKARARCLRNDSTLSEVLLWNRLKNKQMRGYDFHRQKPLGNYIIDFFCPALMLVIEIDGSSHAVDGAYEKDQIRQRELEEMGLLFVRFDDVAVKREMEHVLSVIEQWILDHEMERS